MLRNIRKYVKLNNNKIIKCQNLRDVATAMCKGRFIVLNSSIRKEEFSLKKL